MAGRMRTGLVATALLLLVGVGSACLALEELELEEQQEQTSEEKPSSAEYRPDDAAEKNEALQERRSDSATAQPKAVQATEPKAWKAELNTPSTNSIDLSSITSRLDNRAHVVAREHGYDFSACQRGEAEVWSGDLDNAIASQLEQDWSIAGAGIREAFSTPAGGTFATLHELDSESTYRRIYVCSEPTVTVPEEVASGIFVRIDQALYNRVPLDAAYESVAEVARWYWIQYGLSARKSVLVDFLPQCNAPGLNLYGTEYGFVTTYDIENHHAHDSNPELYMCILLEANSPDIFGEDFTRMLIAHEYFHVLQLNADWEEFSWLSEEGCPALLIEGSATYFGFRYAPVDLESLNFSLSYTYTAGLDAYSALIRLSDADVALFWETEAANCAEAFLAWFGITTSRFEREVG